MQPTNTEHPIDEHLTTVSNRLRFFLNPVDYRYEDLWKGNISLNIFRDLMAGLIVALVAIPLAMGFAIASGLRPEQGIVGGAIAAIIGALFGGSKYQVYGPTAAFIPLISQAVSEFGGPFLILASLLSGLILMGLGLSRFGRLVRLVPDSIVVGFTIGIGCVIVFSQIGQILGLHIASYGHSFVEKVDLIMENYGEINGYSVLVAIGTFALCLTASKISPFVPGPLLALGAGSLLTSTVWAEKGLVSLKDKYGSLPTDFFVITPPGQLEWDPHFLGSLLYFTLGIVFVGAVESLLSSRMADRLANNQGTPFHPDKELWGQGWVNAIIPVLNGFPHTGALARTATNIKVGALSPLAGIFKCFLKLGLVAFFATSLEEVPMACIGGIMAYVAFNMVKPHEIAYVRSLGMTQTLIMGHTAIMVFFTDFLTGVGSALVVYVFTKQVPFRFPSRPSF
ncbi:MAG: SulP family inorganic anion transporter [Nitrospira sp.]|nr:SulP family inorganic anion transporter [Nitrospira sp.]MCA9468924.1 SulP family inorganic anion transporter [Nitrospira sp.]